MNIDEAIKTIEEAISFAHFTPHAPQEKALRLGIEALKYVAHLRDVMVPGVYDKLPGETEEVK